MNEREREGNVGRERDAEKEEDFSDSFSFNFFTRFLAEPFFSLQRIPEGNQKETPFLAREE